MAFQIENLAKYREKKPRIPRGIGLVMLGVTAMLVDLVWAFLRWAEYQRRLVTNPLDATPPTAWFWLIVASIAFVGIVLLAAGISVRRRRG